MSKIYFHFIIVVCFVFCTGYIPHLCRMVEKIWKRFWVSCPQLKLITDIIMCNTKNSFDSKTVILQLQILSVMHPSFGNCWAWRGQRNFHQTVWHIWRKMGKQIFKSRLFILVQFFWFVLRNLIFKENIVIDVSWQHKVPNQSLSGSRRRAVEESSGLVESNFQCKTYETGMFCLGVCYM